jgi:ADP-dependent NAD(P)H-hydrate dehydratase / NAD(P)H-hydrate epimerase
MTISYLSFKESSSFDQQLLRLFGLTLDSLIDRAGTCIASWVQDTIQPCRLIGLIGKGNNGQDVLSAFSKLPKSTYSLVLYPLDLSVCESDLYKEVVALPHVSQWPNFDLLEPQDIFVDGMFGVGLNRELSSEYTLFISKINDFPHRVVSIDVPSGMCETGSFLCVQADWTLCMMFPKKVILDKLKRTCFGNIYVMNFNLTSKQCQNYTSIKSKEKYITL